MTAHGELIEDAAASVCRISPDQLIAVGVNCVHPQNVVPLISRMKHLQRDFIAYPNAGAVWDKDKKSLCLSSSDDAFSDRVDVLENSKDWAS